MSRDSGAPATVQGNEVPSTHRLWQIADDCEERTMIKVLPIVSACAIAAASVARAESWRTGVELIDQWSVFTCVAYLPDRYWDFTLEGSQLSASGPEGAKWTAQVNADGSFKATFTGYWRGRSFEAEVKGNAKDKWAIQHNKTAMCWYRLEPIALTESAPVQPASEWTSIAEIVHGACPGGALARIATQPGLMRLALVDGSKQFAQFEVALSVDGRGQAEHGGSTGEPTRIDIPAGSGKRTLRSARVDGSCRWIWIPN
jgi:hypothetical protein